MKKTLIFLVSGILLFSSCDTYTGAGAYTGGMFGTILGSAIGGITGGHRGANVGAVIGMAGGAVMGAAVGAAADKQEAEERSEYYERSRHYDRDDLHEHYQKVMQNRETRKGFSGENDRNTDDEPYRSSGNSGFDATNSGDDRLYDFEGLDYTTEYSASDPVNVSPGKSEISEINAKYIYSSTLTVKNARLVDTNQDNAIAGGELSKVIFEVYNDGDTALYDVVPVVEEITGNKYIQISPSVHVECLAPGKGIRYTAMVQTNKKLKDGVAEFNIYVLQGGQKISNITQFKVKTQKKK